MKLKYVAYKGYLTDTFVIFPEVGPSHHDMAQYLRIHRDEILGAGFVEITDGNFTVYGRSESLNVDSRPEDAVLMNKLYRI